MTVLNAFSFKPNDKSHILDKQCHQLLAEILRAKKPKVAIRCHRGEYKDSWMKHFELLAKSTSLCEQSFELAETTGQ